MASFKGHTFAEGAEGSTRFPVWERRARTAILEVPGANGDIVQTFGRASDRLALTATCTQAELDALYADVGSSGTLIYHYDSRTAYLESISGPHELLTADLYAVTLNFVG